MNSLAQYPPESARRDEPWKHSASRLRHLSASWASKLLRGVVCNAFFLPTRSSLLCETSKLFD
eukprot:2736801-Karenia_brevis.AAC.1